MLNVLSVDVEDYHDQLALDFQNRIVPPCREVELATDRMLALLAEYGVRGTFFVLGEIAEHFPQLARRIAQQGHQLGVHGYHHHHVYQLSPEEFRQSIDRAKKLIEDVTGQTADAHRAVAFSIVQSTLWALDILVELGFRYDSSIFPFGGWRYGIPMAPRSPYRHRHPDGRMIWEVPMSTVIRFGRRWPACGGGYLRHFPLWFTDRTIAALNREGLGAVVYLHPYELEISPVIRPLPNMSLTERCRFAFFNYHQLRCRRTVAGKLRVLLRKYRFGTIEQVVSSLPELTGGQAGECKSRFSPDV
ncbi:MAG: DUF3473 domain-containing protein [Phycisphaerae bacterium]